MADAQIFHSLAEEFELLSLAFRRSDNPELKKELLARMKAVVDEIDERILQEATCLEHSDRPIRDLPGGLFTIRQTPND